MSSLLMEGSTRESQSPEHVRWSSKMKSNMCTDSGETCCKMILAPAHEALYNGQKECFLESMSMLWGGGLPSHVVCIFLLVFCQSLKLVLHSQLKNLDLADSHFDSARGVDLNVGRNSQAQLIQVHHRGRRRRENPWPRFPALTSHHEPPTTST